MNAVLYPSSRVDIASIAGFTHRIDVRSPAEFNDDHLPGADNHPVLNDEERARVGTLYAESPFAANKLGAALVARNIAAMIERDFADRTRDWRPLIYCWRGGQRSRALTHVLNEIGWRAIQLDGGYRAYRRHVVAELETLPGRHLFIVICGLTGSGKSQLLRALGQAGAQTLDLELIARHRGSLLGALPEAAQPSQKRFESDICATLAGCDPDRPVYVEAESQRIGTMQVPAALLQSMRNGRRITLATPLPQRVALLRGEYGHFVAHPESLRDRLAPLTSLHGKVVLARWERQAAAGEWDALIAELLELHYDPSYRRSLQRHFPAATDAPTFVAADVSPDGFAALAADVIATVDRAALVALEH